MLLGKQVSVAAYWRAVRETEATITDQWPQLVPVTDAQPGIVIETDRKTAARLITEGSHRIATPDEIEAARRRDAETRESIIAAERARVAMAFPAALAQAISPVSQQLPLSGPAPDKRR